MKEIQVCIFCEGFRIVTMTRSKYNNDYRVYNCDTCGKGYTDALMQYYLQNDVNLANATRKFVNGH